MTSTALVPLSPLQQCAMKALAVNEARSVSGRPLPELSFAKAFFRAYTGRTTVTVADIKSVDATYNPVRGGSTKMDYLRAVDVLIESRGMIWDLPLPKNFAASLFPSVFYKNDTRQMYRDAIRANRIDKNTKEEELKQSVLKQNAIRASLIDLQFCRPGQHKQWLSNWRDHLEDVGVSSAQILIILTKWWSAFWISSVYSDWRWCNQLYEFLNEIDYVVERATHLEMCVCSSSLPIFLEYHQ
ncbi:plasmid SOS inhibition protein A [Cronobacter turicensis]